MALAAPLSDQILADRFRKNTDLVGDKCEERSRWSFVGALVTGVAQVAEHERLTKTAMIAAAPPDHCAGEPSDPT